MSVKKILSVLFLIASPICILFLVLLTYFSIADPDNLPALFVFLPIDLVYLLLFWKSIRILLPKQETVTHSISHSEKSRTIICWECGGRNQITTRKPGKCQYCFSNLNKQKKEKYL